MSPDTLQPFSVSWCRFISRSLHNSGKGATLCRLCRLERERENEGEQSERRRDANMQA